MKTRKQRNINLRYLPKKLTARDKKKQSKMLLKSKKLYRKGKYYTRKSVKSFQSKTSSHILKARKVYGVEKIGATNELARKSGGPSDDFTAAGTDYKFVQQRRGELEAKRLEEQANKKRESMDEDRNTLISKMLEMLDLNHTEMINKLQAVN